MFLFFFSTANVWQPVFVLSIASLKLYDHLAPYVVDCNMNSLDDYTYCKLADWNCKCSHMDHDVMLSEMFVESANRCSVPLVEYETV